MTVSAIVPAGGRGERLGGGAPKQFRPLLGRPLLNWSVSRLIRVKGVVELVIGVPEDWLTTVQEVVAPAAARVGLQVVAGGERRQDTVRRCLAAVRPGTEVVVIHDAARPFVTVDLIERTIAAAAIHGAATAGLRPADTIRSERGKGSEDLDRDRLWIIQTPQAFRLPLIQQAHAAAQAANFIGTDDAALVERIGAAVAIVPGSALNLKVTTAEDWRIAEALAAAGLGDPARALFEET